MTRLEIVWFIQKLKIRRGMALRLPSSPEKRAKVADLTRRIDGLQAGLDSAWVRTYELEDAGGRHVRLDGSFR